MYDIERQIIDGTLGPGERLPSYHQLADRYGCSVQPVKVAFGILEHTRCPDRPPRQRRVRRRPCRHRPDGLSDAISELTQTRPGDRRQGIRHDGGLAGTRTDLWEPPTAPMCSGLAVTCCSRRPTCPLWPWPAPL